MNNLFARLAMAFVLAVGAMAAAVPGAARAEAPYHAYSYDEWGHSQASPAGYLPERTYTGAEVGGQHFSEPQDLFVDHAGNVYVADTGNARIVVLDSEFRLTQSIDHLSLNGQPLPLKRPTGVYVSAQGTLYIADEGRILRANGRLQADLVLEKPIHPLIAGDFVFKPVKVAADKAGRIYVLSEGLFFGLMQFDPKGEFMGYYGSNKVEVTPYVVLETFWKRILTKSQREAMAKLLPIEYSNLDIGADGFVYTTTIISKNSREEIKKLNPLGNNVLVNADTGNDFGDREFSQRKGVRQDTSFVDVAVHPDGFIAGLDRTRGRVFEYDSEGNPVAVFGSLGNQRGTFLQPTAVAYQGNAVLVLDAAKRNITRFVPTEYGSLVHRATLLYAEGRYAEAAEIWHQASRRDMNNREAYAGIAKALENEGKYEEALPYYRLGADRGGYSDSYGKIRIQTVREHLPLIMSLLGCPLLGYYGRKAYRYAKGTATKKKTARNPLLFRRKLNPLKALLHPFDSFYAVKEEGKGSLLFAGVIVTIFFFASIASRQNTGFIFNPHELNDLNVLLIAAKTIVLYGLWVSCNWAVATWMDGEGKAKEIAIISAYALTPYVAALILTTLLSNVLVLEEGVFLPYMTAVSLIWSGVLMLVGFLAIHDYGFKRTLTSVLLTFAAMAIVVFLAMLFYTLFQQTYLFVKTIYNELMFRI
ncbi:YIP1 family protein [Cohnella sp.]|uniref:YIP1 family protein n=1 Tax=Cohnella sp. TaxID=1883426 RepID=UPI003569D23A